LRQYFRHQLFGVVEFPQGLDDRGAVDGDCPRPFGFVDVSPEVRAFQFLSLGPGVEAVPDELLLPSLPESSRASAPVEPVASDG